MKTEGNEPINPGKIYKPIYNALSGQSAWHDTQGLTKREYFAAMAMQGLLASVTLSSIPVKVRIDMAVESADALINALNQTK